MKPYCTQNNGDCSTCALVSYGRDCLNNPIVDKIEVIRARVSPELKLQAEALAAKKGMNLSEYIRYLLQREIEP